MSSTPSPHDEPAAPTGQLLQRATVVLFVSLLLAKVLVATKLGLFSDEAFYWQCAARPDIAYRDHPFMTAALVGLGVEILGHTSVGVRLLFLGLGALFPFAIYLLARPLTGERDAIWAAALSLVLPTTAQLGLLAIPDVPLLFFSALTLAGFERATRTAELRHWLWFGAACALGLCSHYRFVLVPAAIGVYLLVTRHGRAQWRAGGVWLGIAIAVLGLLPGLLYNLRFDFVPLGYQLATRHQFAFDLQELLEHIGRQAAIVTPLLYVALLGVLVSLWRRAHGGNDRCALLAIFASVNLGVYLAASPFEDTRLSTMHWPVPGYLPLLVFLPETLRRFLAINPSRWRRTLTALAVGLPVFLAALGLIELGSGLFKLQFRHTTFGGWQEAATEARHQLPHIPRPADGRPIVVADNYKLGTNLDFRLHPDVDLYILNHQINRDHGRQSQFELWGTDETALRKRAGEDALVIVQWTQTRTADRERWMAHVRSVFRNLEPLSEITVPGPRRHKRFLFFWGRSILPPGKGPGKS